MVTELHPRVTALIMAMVYRGHTRTTLALASDTPVARLAAIFAGSDPGSTAEWGRLAHVLELDMWELVDGKVTPLAPPKPSTQELRAQLVQRLVDNGHINSDEADLLLGDD